MQPIQRQRGEPLACLAAWRTDLDDSDALLLVDFQLACWWLPGAEVIDLTAIYAWLEGRLLISVTERVVDPAGAEPALLYRQYLQQYRLAAVSPGQVLALAAQHIAKPWGQEIWFTGVEERGLCHFSANGQTVPIPWLQAVVPGDQAGPAGVPLVLLKILDPSPREVTGDLYFELHEEKREVYVVTRVDPQAWPDGVGYIRYGFDPDRIAAAGGEEGFKREYREAVAAYEAVRRAIDDLPEGAEPSTAQLNSERNLRAAMNDFTHLQPLQVGDVVVVPLLMPHSLQHGVRTVEFQTPVYERQILSFAQRVLTQDHWDTDAAVGQMRLLPPPAEPFAQLPAGQGVLVERIVDFPDFEVQRVRLEPGATLELETLQRYALTMVVEGELALEGQNYGPEEAQFLPVGWSGGLGSADPAGTLVFLFAMPRS